MPLRRPITCLSAKWLTRFHEISEHVKWQLIKPVYCRWSNWGLQIYNIGTAHFVTAWYGLIRECCGSAFGVFNDLVTTIKPSLVHDVAWLTLTALDALVFRICSGFNSWWLRYVSRQDIWLCQYFYCDIYINPRTRVIIHSLSQI